MKRNLIFTLVLTISISLSVMFFPCQSEAANSIERVSVDDAGVEADRVSEDSSISGDGRYVAFESDATNLLGVGVDTNNQCDIFVYDRTLNTIERVSVDAGGAQANDRSRDPSISSDGTYVAFESEASNLITGGTTTWSVYVKNRLTGAISLASADAAGTEGNGSSYDPSISSDGNYVAFESDATNLIAGDGNGVRDVFVKRIDTGAIWLASADAADTQGNALSDDPAISPDGLYVAFESDATNWASGGTTAGQVYLKNIATGAIWLVSADAAGDQGTAGSDDVSVSLNGEYVAFESDATNLIAGDTNNDADCFVKTIASGAIERVSTDATGAQANDASREPKISSDGNYVAFRSYADDLVAGDNDIACDIFVKDRNTGKIDRLSVDNSGVEGDNISDGHRISSDGTHVSFCSEADNLVAGDGNSVADIFVNQPDFSSPSTPPDDDDSGGGGCFINTCSIFK